MGRTHDACREGGCKTVESTKAFVHSDWLYCLWHGINQFKSCFYHFRADDDEEEDLLSER